MHAVLSASAPRSNWLLLALLAHVSLSLSLSAADKLSILVEAGDYDRRDAVVTLPLPPEARSARALRRAGETIPLQVESDGRGVFILRELKKGTTVSYELMPGGAQAGAGPDRVRAKRDGTRLRVDFSDGAATPDRLVPLLDYQAEPSDLPRADIKPVFKRGGYLHPIRTLSGRVVTDDYPPNHIHHHGVWWAWTKTEFDGREPDFWNMGEGKGRVEWVALESSWEGPVHAGFRARHRFVDLTSPTPVVALHETWKVTVFRPGALSAKAWMFDLESEQTCATGQPLRLPSYRYGGLGVRGSWSWNGKEHAYFLTSEGETDRDRAHATRARWCDIGGQVDGQRVGLTILGHPENFRAPQPMRVHPTEPFFNFAPQQAGDMALEPGAVYRSRYRLVVHDGPPDRAELDRLWNDFAFPPRARGAPGE